MASPARLKAIGAVSFSDATRPQLKLDSMRHGLIKAGVNDVDWLIRSLEDFLTRVAAINSGNQHGGKVVYNAKGLGIALYVLASGRYVLRITVFVEMYGEIIKGMDEIYPVFGELLSQLKNRRFEGADVRLNYQGGEGPIEKVVAEYMTNSGFTEMDYIVGIK